MTKSLGKLQWKDEDEEDGIPIGPVWILGEPSEWLTKPQAIKIAKDMGLEFEEV